MSGSLTHGGGKNFPGIPGACATRNFTYLERGPLAHVCIAYVLLIQRVRRLHHQGFNVREARQSAKQRSVLFMPTTDNGDMAIWTLFTTLQNSRDNRYIQENTIRNWHLLSPDFVPLLFAEVDPSDPKGIAHVAVQRGWHIFQCQRRVLWAFPFWNTFFWKLRRNPIQHFIVAQIVIFSSTEISNSN